MDWFWHLRTPTTEIKIFHIPSPLVLFSFLFLSPRGLLFDRWRRCRQAQLPIPLPITNKLKMTRPTGEELFIRANRKGKGKRKVESSQKKKGSGEGMKWNSKWNEYKYKLEHRRRKRIDLRFQSINLVQQHSYSSIILASNLSLRLVSYPFKKEFIKPVLI